VAHAGGSATPTRLERGKKKTEKEKKVEGLALGSGRTHFQAKRGWPSHP